MACYGAVDVVAGGKGVFERIRELPEDGRDVERGVVAPVAPVVFDVVGGDEPGDADALAAEVGGVERGDGDLVVEGGLGVVGVEEFALLGEGVAEEEHLRGVETLEGLHVRLLDALGLGDDDEEVGGVEALEVVLGVGGEGDGEALLVYDVLGVGDLAGEGIAGGCDGESELVPEDVPDLPESGAGDDDLGMGPGVEPPDDGAGGGPVLAGGVARGDGDAGVAREGAQYLLLLVVGFACGAEDVPGEADGVVLVAGEHGGDLPLSPPSQPSPIEGEGGLLRRVNEKSRLACSAGRLVRSFRGSVGCGVYVISVTDARQLRKGGVSHYGGMSC